MTEHEQVQNTIDLIPTNGTEPIIYEEPAQLGWKDMMGVVVALIMLIVIGVVGYIWLTPGLDVNAFLAKLQHSTAIDAMQHDEHTKTGHMAVAVPDSEVRCDNCGMFWNKSVTRVRAMFNFNRVKHENHFVCLNCVYEYSNDNYGGAQPVQLQVLDYNSVDSDEPVLLNADQAWYLYGTKPLPGSMVPFIAAFATREDATALQPELGGELVQFTEANKRLLERNQY